MKTEARQKLDQYDLAKMQYETFKTIYIAGPMTGLPDFNRENFNWAAMRLKKDGWDVKNPADLGDIPGATWGDYMRLGLKSLLTCSTIYMLKGWEGSKGAKIELAVAKELGMKELYEKGLEDDAKQAAPAPVPSDDVVQKTWALLDELEKLRGANRDEEDWDTLNKRDDELRAALDAVIDAAMAASSKQGGKP